MVMQVPVKCSLLILEQVWWEKPWNTYLFLFIKYVFFLSFSTAVARWTKVDLCIYTDSFLITF